METEVALLGATNRNNYFDLRFPTFGGRLCGRRQDGQKSNATRIANPHFRRRGILVGSKMGAEVTRPEVTERNSHFRFAISHFQWQGLEVTVPGAARRNSNF